MHWDGVFSCDRPADTDQGLCWLALILISFSTVSCDVGRQRNGTGAQRSVAAPGEARFIGSVALRAGRREVLTTLQKGFPNAVLLPGFVVAKTFAAWEGFNLCREGMRYPLLLVMFVDDSAGAYWVLEEKYGVVWDDRLSRYRGVDEKEFRKASVQIAKRGDMLDYGGPVTVKDLHLWLRPFGTVFDLDASTDGDGLLVTFLPDRMGAQWVGGRMVAGIYSITGPGCKVVVTERGFVLEDLRPLPTENDGNIVVDVQERMRLAGQKLITPR